MQTPLLTQLVLFPDQIPDRTCSVSDVIFFFNIISYSYLCSYELSTCSCTFCSRVDHIPTPENNASIEQWVIYEQKWCFCPECSHHVAMQLPRYLLNNIKHRYKIVVCITGVLARYT